MTCGHESEHTSLGIPKERERAGEMGSGAVADGGAWREVYAQTYSDKARGKTRVQSKDRARELDNRHIRRPNFDALALASTAVTDLIRCVFRMRRLSSF